MGADQPRERAPSTGPASRFPHHGSLDGLRALAVVAIVAYHLGYPWAHGAFLAVDLFFVLSGFLITTLLIFEGRRRGTVRLRQFWIRRARRLLPAMLLTLVAVAVFTRLEVDPWTRSSVRGDGLASLFYVANWRFIAAQQGYFQVFAAPSPLRHMWTLAIEEQFYLVWPLIFFACLRLGRGSLKVLAALCAAGVAGSTAVMAATFEPGDPLRAYYGTDSRAHVILLGALLAIVLAVRPPGPAMERRLGIAGPVAFAALLAGWAVAEGTDAAYYRGGSVVHAVLVCVVIASALHRGPLRRALGIGPAAWVGRLSYGLYLFHWPVIVWLVPTRVPADGLALDVLRVATTVAAAVASYYLIELPVRERRLPTPVVALRRAVTRSSPRTSSTPPARRVRERWLVVPGLAVAFAAVLASAGGATPAPSYLVGEQAPAANLAAAGPGSEGLDEPWALGDPLFCGTPRPEETAEAEATAVEGGPVDAPGGAGVRLLLVGDSTACSLYPGLAAVADQAGTTVTEAVVFGCGVASGEVTSTRGEQTTPNSHRCPAMVDVALDEAEQQPPPDVVVWMSIWEKSDLVVGDEVLESDSEEGREEMLRRMDAALDRLTVNGAHVAVITVAAPAPNDADGVDNTSNAVDDASYQRLDEVLAEFADRHPDEVTLIDMADRLCPDGPPCPRVVDGEVQRPDGRHLTPAAAARQALWLLPQLVELGR